MVTLDQIIAVSNHATLYKAIASKGNGLILEDLSTGKNIFFSGRLHQFSPLDSMGLYTMGGTMPLREVYELFLSREAEHEVPKDNAAEADLRTFFENAVPDYDPYRVHARDMKKCVRWYHQLKSFELIRRDDHVQQ
ncbi:MAG: hypothetical protein U0T81_05880 [Saprospiraceae bacterium]